MNFRKYLKNDIRDYKYYNYPYKVERKKYKEIKDKIVGELYSIDGVLAVYSFGNIGAPGISDIDILIVVEDDFSKSKDIVLMYSLLSEEEKYVAFCHYPFIVFKSLADRMFEILPLSNAKLEKGVDFKIDKELSKETITQVTGELICLFYPKIFLSILLTKSIDVRNTIQVLNALRFPLIAVMKYYEHKKNEYVEYISRLDELKKNWEKKDKDILGGEILRLLMDAIEIIFIMIDEVSLNSPKLNKLTTAFYNHTIFRNKYSHDKAFKTTMKIYRYTGAVCTILPVSFYYFASVLSGKYIIKDVSESYKQRCTLYSSYGKLLIQTELHCIVPYPFNFRLMNRSNIKEMVFRSIEKIVNW